MQEEIEYINEDAPKKSLLGKNTMAYLAHVYIIEHGGIDTSQPYNANKILRGLSKLYQEAGRDVERTANRLRVGKMYFEKDKPLDWTPEAVWRNWEKIKYWYEHLEDT